MNYRCDHVHLYCRDVEATAQWYAQVFDARILRARQSDGRPRVDLQLGDLTIYLGDARKLQGSLGWTLAESAPSPRYGLDHFGLAVDDLDAAARQLQARGATISHGPKTLRPGAQCLFVDAPDGVTIEILYRDRAIDAVPIEATSERRGEGTS